ncbi:hypothetical protein RFI_36995, partial [Reticulomyxa filosa]
MSQEEIETAIIIEMEMAREEVKTEAIEHKDSNQMAASMDSDWKDNSNNNSNNSNNSSSKDVELPQKIGTVVWYLCQLSTHPSLPHPHRSRAKPRDGVTPETRLIEDMLSKCYDLNDPSLRDAMHLYWTSLTQEQSPSKKDRKQQMQRAQKNAMKQMEKQKKLFQMKNSQILDEDILNEKKEGLIHGIGYNYSCVSCHSTENSDQMGLLAFATSDRDIGHVAHDRGEKKSGGETHRQGVQWTFCGHAMHFFCFNEYFAGLYQRIENPPVLRSSHHEFVCPYCK